MAGPRALINRIENSPRCGAGVNNTAFQPDVTAWTDVAATDSLADGKPARVDAGGVPVVLVHKGETVHALSATCVHASGPSTKATSCRTVTPSDARGTAARSVSRTAPRSASPLPAVSPAGTSPSRTAG